MGYVTKTKGVEGGTVLAVIYVGPYVNRKVMTELADAIADCTKEVPSDQVSLSIAFNNKGDLARMLQNYEREPFPALDTSRAMSKDENMRLGVPLDEISDHLQATQGMKIIEQKRNPHSDATLRIVVHNKNYLASIADTCIFV